MNTNQPPLNPDAIRVATTAAHDAVDWQMYDVTKFDLEDSVDVATIAAVSAYLAVAQPVVNSVEAFINQRPEYIQVLKNTRSGDDMSDYCRWQGHAESRRQLAQKLGWTVPHNPGETTRPEVKP